MDGGQLHTEERVDLARRETLAGVAAVFLANTIPIHIFEDERDMTTAEFSVRLQRAAIGKLRVEIALDALHYFRNGLVVLV